MQLPIKWIKDETGKVIGYEKYTTEEVVAAKEAELLKMYNELETLKSSK